MDQNLDGSEARFVAYVKALSEAPVMRIGLGR
jgi:hypothetical protein